MSEPATLPQKQQRENLFVNLGFNLLFPILLLSKGGKYLPLSDTQILVLALAFPVSYFLFDYSRRKTINTFSILGFTSVLLTGGLGLFQTDPLFFALKEAAIPLVLGTILLATANTKRPLLNEFLLNPSVIHVDRLYGSLDSPEKETAFRKLLRKCTWLMAASFLISATVNFTISRLVVKTHPSANMEAYNAEVAQQMWITWVVMAIISLPIMGYALWTLFSGLTKITGQEVDYFLHDQAAAKVKDTQ